MRGFASDKEEVAKYYFDLKELLRLEDSLWSSKMRISAWLICKGFKPQLYFFAVLNNKKRTTNR